MKFKFALLILLFQAQAFAMNSRDLIGSFYGVDEKGQRCDLDIKQSFHDDGRYSARILAQMRGTEYFSGLSSIAFEEGVQENLISMHEDQRSIFDSIKSSFEISIILDNDKRPITYIIIYYKHSLWTGKISRSKAYRCNVLRKI